MKYKVHVAYISSITGQTVPVGEYDESELNLSEARNRTIITAVDSSQEVKEVPLKDDVIKVLRFGQESDFVEKSIRAHVSVLSPVLLPINTASAEDIAKVKYVSRKVADKVVAFRETKRFSNYEQLDEAAPLGFKRKWEDVIAIDFDAGKPAVTVTNTNSLSFT